MVKFLYTGRIQLIDGMFALKLFVAVDRYGVQTLKNMVGDYINKNITNVNVIQAFYTSYTLESNMIKIACLNTESFSCLVAMISLPEIVLLESITAERVRTQQVQRTIAARK